jgi:hypothetical protein
LEDTIITIYCLCDDFLKAINRFDDPQVRLTTAEVMSVPLVAATFFGDNIDKTCRFLYEYGYMPKMISKGRFNHRLRGIEPWLWEGLFSLLAEFFKKRNSEEERSCYAVDSLPVAACEKIRIKRCRLYPLEEHGGSVSGLRIEQAQLFLRFAGASGGNRSGRTGGVLRSCGLGGRR